MTLLTVRAICHAEQGSDITALKHLDASKRFFGVLDLCCVFTEFALPQCWFWSHVFVLCCFVERGQPLESVEIYAENTYVQDSYVCVRVL